MSWFEMDYEDISRQIAEVAKDYQYHKPPDAIIFMQDAVTRGLRLLYDLLSSLHIEIPGLADSSMVSTVMRVLVVAVAAVALIIIMAVMWSRLGKLANQSRLAKNGQLATHALLDAAGWQTESQFLADKGDWRNACRALYLSVLCLLDEKGIISFRPSRSNYEYYYALAPYGRLANLFRQMVCRVEDSWFGNYQAKQEDYELCKTCHDSLASEVQQAYTSKEMKK